MVDINMESLVETIQAFINADNWNASCKIVDDHPELLNDITDTVLRQLTTAQNDDSAKAIIEEHRQLLERCRAVGTEAAFAEKTGDSIADVPTELQKILSELLQPARITEMPRRIQFN